MAIFDELKSIGGVLQEAGEIEQYRQILDAQKALLEMQKTIADLELENKILKEKIKFKESIVLDRGTYWTEIDGKKDGPFCTLCWDDEGKLLRLQEGHFLNGVWGSCRKCKSKYR